MAACECSAQQAVFDCLNEFVADTKQVLDAVQRFHQLGQSAVSQAVSSTAMSQASDAAVQAMTRAVMTEAKLRDALRRVSAQRKTQAQIETLKEREEARVKIVGSRLFYPSFGAEESLRASVDMCRAMCDAYDRACEGAIDAPSLVSYACRISGSMSAPPPPPNNICRDASSSLFTVPIPLAEKMRQGLLMQHGAPAVALPSLVERAAAPSSSSMSSPSQHKSGQQGQQQQQQQQQQQHMQQKPGPAGQSHQLGHGTGVRAAAQAGSGGSKEPSPGSAGTLSPASSLRMMSASTPPVTVPSVPSVAVAMDGVVGLGDLPGVLGTSTPAPGANGGMVGVVGEPMEISLDLSADLSWGVASGGPDGRRPDSRIANDQDDGLQFP